jgi:formylglycine-generating enzyme required for sulfatase activity
VETVSWYDAVAYTNQLTLQQGGTPCYLLANVTCSDGTGVGADYMSCMNNTAGGITSATAALNGVASGYDCSGFRLPTDAEWEYAARAGDMRPTYNGDAVAAGMDCTEPNGVLDPIAWFCGNSGRVTHVKKDRLANPWGLYDMLGNVSEWCNDWWEPYLFGSVTDPVGPGSGSGRVIRGGGWFGPARAVRAANRDSSDPGYGWDGRGFRIARSLP